MGRRGTGCGGTSDFLKLWLGQTVSKFGSGITGSALSLAAVLVLGASATQMGLLSAARSYPWWCWGSSPGCGSIARRLPVLIWADLGRALILLTVPGALAGRTSLAQLFFVAGTGALTAFFDVAYQAYVPDLVGRRRVLEANSKLSASEALAEVTTRGLWPASWWPTSRPPWPCSWAPSLRLLRPRAPARRGPPSPRPPAEEAQGSRTGARRSGRGCAWWPATPYLRAIAGTAAGQSFLATSSDPLPPSSSAGAGLGPVAAAGVAIGIEASQPPGHAPGGAGDARGPGGRWSGRSCWPASPAS